MPPLRSVLRERVEEWTGMTVAPAEEVSRLREAASDWGAFADETEDFVLNVLDYVGGAGGSRPGQSVGWRRRRLARQSRRAIIEDPVAGAEANLRSNFAFGRGVPPPEATEPKVQEVINRAWDDSTNRRKLTGFEAQRKRSNDLLASANLFPAYFTSNGQIKLAFLDDDLVTEVVTHPEDDESPLWYVVYKRKVDWNFSLDSPQPDYSVADAKVFYARHWRNVEDATIESEFFGTEAPPMPPEDRTLPGRVEHFRINRVGRTEFGIPPFARQLRFHTALNQLTEAQVAMRQAAATIVAKRTQRSGPRDVLKAASGLIARGGVLAAQTFGRAGEAPATAGPGTNPTAAQAPPPAGSWWVENESDNLQAVRLSSGAGEAIQDGQLVRAALAAASGFGQNYLGDPSSSHLSGAVALELPTLMNVRAWQETFEQLLRWFVDRAIETAIYAGDLGGMISEDRSAANSRPLSELHLPEDQKELERRTGLDLSYSFDMPYPGRRNLPEVIQAVNSIAVTFDPDGVSVPLQRALLNYAFRNGFEMDKPDDLVDSILPEDQLPPAAGKRKGATLQIGGPGPPGMLPPDQGGGIPGVQRNPVEGDAKSQYGEPRRGNPAAGDMGGKTLAALEEALVDDDVEQALRIVLGRDADAALASIDPTELLATASNGASRH